MAEGPPRYLCYFCEVTSAVDRGHAAQLGLNVYLDRTGRLVVPYCPGCRGATSVAQRIALEDYLVRDVRCGLAPGVVRAVVIPCTVPGCSVQHWPVPATAAEACGRVCPWCVADGTEDFTRWEAELRAT